MESKPFLGTVSSLREAYPEIDTLAFVAVEIGDLPREKDRRDVRYSAANIPGAVPCGNPRCQQGGYDLNGVLAGLTASGETSYEFDWSCNGHEGTPKGRRIGNPCMNLIKGTIMISYRQSES